jgi:hypothetical protein
VTTRFGVPVMPKSSGSRLASAAGKPPVAAKLAAPHVAMPKPSLAHAVVAKPPVPARTVFPKAARAPKVTAPKSSTPKITLGYSSPKK